MLLLLVALALAALQCDASPFPFDAATGTIDWHAYHAAAYPSLDHLPKSVVSDKEEVNVAWPHCRLCRQVVSYVDRVRHVADVSCPVLVAGVDLTCDWLARRRLSAACGNLTSDVGAIKASLQRGLSGSTICHRELHMCGLEYGMKSVRVVANHLPVENASCVDCWLAAQYADAARRVRGLPTDAIATGIEATCNRGQISLHHHRPGCKALAAHASTMVALLANGTTSTMVCRHLDQCLPQTVHEDEPSDDVLTWVCVVMVLLACAALVWGCLRAAHTNDATAYMALPRDEKV
ncbi:Aste57867_18430 [Aphanomyces stellatus]|uniref:Aste57867_18430 protein n=1 Tax=Aphanomyces stellatus TaxID=120398 RepID=A0A485LAN2_9STRA|nr:hypothetical protein As57867_018368 [Aphanomyces stellatus]VFT95166.1 Aste57867_18430 [Aphanomyces stellatus]